MSFFAHIISQKQRTPQRKKLQSNVSQVKRSPHAKFSYFLALSQWPKYLGDILACGLSIIQVSPNVTKWQGIWRK